LGVGGHLTALRRERVGPFAVADAVDVYGGGEPGERRPVTEEFASGIASRVVPAGDAVRAAFPTRQIDEAQALDLRHGRTIAGAGLTGTYGAFDATGALVALAVDQGGVTRSVLGWQAGG
jgi:tRNA pseudouridine55 synthase